MTDSRRRIYIRLLDDPARTWTVRELSNAVDCVSGGTVRDTVNQLLAAGHLRQVPRQRALTSALTDDGHDALLRLLDAAASHAPPAR